MRTSLIESMINGSRAGQRFGQHKPAWGDPVIQFIAERSELHCIESKEFGSLIIVIVFHSAYVVALHICASICLDTYSCRH